VIGLIPRKGLDAGARPATPGAGVLPLRTPKTQSPTSNIGDEGGAATRKTKRAVNPQWIHGPEHETADYFFE
jgi:hypothetical protein